MTNKTFLFNLCIKEDAWHLYGLMTCINNKELLNF